MVTNTSSWADLPSDLLVMIGKCLKTRIDNSRIRSVCTTWRSSVPSFRNPIKFPLDMPLTIHHKFCERIFPDDVFYHFRLTEKTIYRLEPVMESSSTMKCWVICVEEFEGGIVHLINPVTGVHIQPLPLNFPRVLDLSNFRLTELQKVYQLVLNKKSKFNDGKIYVDFWKKLDVWKVVFLSNPTKEDEILIAVLHIGGMLSFFQYGNTKEWILLKDIESKFSFIDIVNYKGNLCAIGGNGKSFIVDSSFNVTEIAPHKDHPFTFLRLIEPLGFRLEIKPKKYYFDFSELFYDEPINDINIAIKDYSVKVYTLHDEELRWIEVANLDGRVFFTSNRLLAFWNLSLLFSEIPFCLKSCVISFDRGQIAIYLGRSNPEYIDKFPGDAEMFWPPPNWLATGNPS